MVVTQQIHLNPQLTNQSLLIYSASKEAVERESVKIHIKTFNQLTNLPILLGVVYLVELLWLSAEQAWWSRVRNSTL